MLGSFLTAVRALCSTRGGVHARGFLPALHSVKGALGVRTYFIVLAHLDSVKTDVVASEERDSSRWRCVSAIGS